MKIKKPYKFILIKKYPDKYFDYIFDREFPKSEINEHPVWYKEEFDNDGNLIYREYHDGYWLKWEHNEHKQIIYHECSNGRWYKKEYDENGYITYFEDSDGVIKGVAT